MTKTQALLRSLHQLTNQRRALKATEHRLDTEQRKVMDKLSRALGQVGFRIVPVGGMAGTVPGTRRRGRRHPRKNLKCPKCDRPFGFEMHLARHRNTAHGTKKRAGKKRAA